MHANTNQRAPLPAALRRMFSVDLRSLAAFRISMALVLLADLWVRAGDLAAHYSDAGVLPRASLVEWFGGSWAWSLHLASGSVVVQGALFAVAAAFAVALLVGYRTRTVAFGSWLLLVSLHARNPLVLQGGDVLLRVMLFWACFLPLGAVFSVDAALWRDDAEGGEAARTRTPHLSAASVAIVLQLVFVYAFTSAFKTHPIWTDEASAAYYALAIDQFRTPVGDLVYGLPRLLPALTIATRQVELFGPLLAFSPLLFGPLRTAAVALFASLHLGFGLCLSIGLFSQICLAAWLVFLPPWFWERLAAWRRRTHPEPLTIETTPEGERAARLARSLLVVPDVAIATSAALAPGQHWQLRIGASACHSATEALRELATASPWARPFARPRLLALTSATWRAFASCLARPGGRALARLRPAAPLRPLPALVEVAVALGLVLVFLVNWDGLQREGERGRAMQTLHRLAYAVRLDQKWNMFAPFPLRADGWYVMPGELVSGREVDVYRGPTSVDWQKPPRVADTYPNNRWRKYLMTLRLDDSERYRNEYGRYLCRSWNHGKPTEARLWSFDIVFVEEYTESAYTTRDPRRVTLWRHQCYRERPEVRTAAR